MHRLETKRFEDEQIEGALNDVGVHTMAIIIPHLLIVKMWRSRVAHNERAGVRNDPGSYSLAAKADEPSNSALIAVIRLLSCSFRLSRSSQKIVLASAISNGRTVPFLAVQITCLPSPWA